jgi:hypothetical protein
MRREQAGCGDFARTDAHDRALTFAGSKSRSAAACRRAALCYRLEYNEFTPEALLEGR